MSWQRPDWEELVETGILLDMQLLLLSYHNLCFMVRG